jgi:hypothetical protein
MTADKCGVKAYSWEAEALAVRRGASSLDDIKTSHCGIERRQYQPLRFMEATDVDVKVEAWW